MEFQIGDVVEWYCYETDSWNPGIITQIYHTGYLILLTGPHPDLHAVNIKRVARMPEHVRPVVL